MKVRAKLTKTYVDGVPSYTVALSAKEIYSDADAEETLSKVMAALDQTILRDATAGTKEKKKPVRRD